MAKYLKSPYILALILFYVLQVEALIVGTTTAPQDNSLPTPTSESLTTPFISTKPSSTNTLLATASESSSVTRLYFPLSTNAPDPIGFSQVSGFYGPGAWAGWFITIVASWYRVFFEGESDIDLNTWLYLLGTNWAGLDFVRHVFKARALGGCSTTEGKKEVAQLGAAFNVLWWGSVHGLLQLYGWYQIQENIVRRVTRGFLTVIIGLLLPMVCLTIALFTTIDYRIPALYWEGMEETDNIHYRAFFSVVGPSTLLFPTLILVWPGLQPLGIPFLIHIATSFCKVLDFSYTIITPFCLIVKFWVVLNLATRSVTYIYEAYTSWGRAKISQSCFFMPCAPQSISESDQAFALLAGLVSFVGAEIAPRLLKKAREARKSQRLFEQETRRRIDIEMTRRTNSGVRRQWPS